MQKYIYWDAIYDMRVINILIKVKGESWLIITINWVDRKEKETAPFKQYQCHVRQKITSNSNH